MSRSELVRLVTTAERDLSIRSELRRARSVQQLVSIARQLGFAIERRDLELARAEHEHEQLERDLEARKQRRRIRRRRSQPPPPADSLAA